MVDQTINDTHNSIRYCHTTSISPLYEIDSLMGPPFTQHDSDQPVSSIGNHRFSTGSIKVDTSRTRLSAFACSRTPDDDLRSIIRNEEDVQNRQSLPNRARKRGEDGTPSTRGLGEKPLHPPVKLRRTPSSRFPFPNPLPRSVLSYVPRPARFSCLMTPRPRSLFCSSV